MGFYRARGLIQASGRLSKLSNYEYIAWAPLKGLLLDYLSYLQRMTRQWERPDCLNSTVSGREFSLHDL